MGLLMAGAILAAMSLAAGADPGRQPGPGAVRPEDDELRRLIARGAEHSETFRKLMAQLDEGDVTIYVRFGRCAGRVRACTLWASDVPTLRRLLIRVDRFAGSERTVTAALAHELQHAAEVAATPTIVDVESFRRGFEQRGWKWTHGYETNEAREVDRRVLAELSRRRPTPSAPTRLPSSAPR